MFHIKISKSVLSCIVESDKRKPKGESNRWYANHSDPRGSDGLEANILQPACDMSATEKNSGG